MLKTDECSNFPAGTPIGTRSKTLRASVKCGWKGSCRAGPSPVGPPGPTDVDQARVRLHLVPSHKTPYFETPQVYLSLSFLDSRTSLPTIRVNNCDLYYETRGNDRNPPIVLLHAFPLDHNVWNPQAKDLAKNYWIITPALRGHGQSEATSGTYSMDLLARDVKALLEKLRIKNLVLGGLSIGGYVAFAYRRLFPDDIQALILVDTKADADTPQAKTGRKELADLVLTKGVASFADRMLPRLFSKQNLETNATIVKEARKTIETMNPSGIVGGLQSMAERPDSTPLLDQIRVPTLIIVGENDQTTTVDDAKKMTRIAASKLVIVPNAGHISTLEQPERVSSAIRAFLQESQLQQRASTA